MAAKTIASLAIGIGVDLTQFEKDMKEFNKTWGKVGAQMQDVGKKVGAAFTGAGVAVAAGLGVAVNTAMEFDAQMSRAGAIAGATAEELQAMRQTALDLGASTSKSASEVALGMEMMAAKGYTATEAIAAMPGVIAASEASGEDMALVANTVASALNAFGLEASDAGKIADIMAMSANTSAAGINDLQFAFKYAAPVANSLGISMEELAAATGIMADNGMKGEQAGTTLRAALLRLTDPPKEARQAMDDLGLSVTDAAGNFLPFDQIIAQLSTSTASMTDAQKAAALSTIFGTEAMTGMLSLIEAGPEKLNQLTLGLQNSAGASADTAAVMKDNLKGSMEELSGAIETMQISLGSALAPAIRAVADGLSAAVGWFNSLSPQTQKMIAIAAGLTAGLLVLIGVVGFLIAALGMLAAVQWAVVAPMLATIGVVAAIGVAIAVLVILVIKYWDEIKAATVAAWNAIKTALSAAWDFIVGIFKAVWSKIEPVVKQLWEGVKTVFNAYINTVKTIITAAWEVIKTIFATAFLAIVYLVTGQWDKIGSLFSAAGDKIKNIMSDAWDKIKNIWSSAFTALKNSVTAAWDGIKKIFQTSWDGIKKWFGGTVEDAKSIGADIIRGMIDGIASMAKALASKAKEVVSSAVDAAKNFLGINSPSKLFMEIGGWTGEGFAIGLENTTDMAADASLAVGAAASSSVPEMQADQESNGRSNNNMTVIIELDGRAIAKSTMDFMGGTFRVRGAVT